MSGLATNNLQSNYLTNAATGEMIQAMELAFAGSKLIMQKSYLKINYTFLDWRRWRR